MASTVLSRNVSSAGNRKTWTYSVWLKRSGLGADNYFVAQGTDSNNNWTMGFDNNDVLFMWNYVSGFQIRFTTNRKFRDTNSWYHIMLAVDTTQNTEADRVKIYVNGVQETSFSVSTYPSQDFDTIVNSTTGSFYVGNYVQGSGHYNGCMSHVHFCDGSALAPTVFGSTDSTTGEWKINTSPSFTPGTNGFTILKDGNTVTDQSANSNNFTVAGGTLTKTEDCPSNVFATWNRLFPAGGSLNYDAGSTRLYNTGTAAYRTSVSTLGASTGKFYAEFKCEGDTFFTGVLDINNTKMGINDTTFGSSSNMTSYGYGIFNSTGNVSNNGSTVVSGYSSALANGDILGVALDATNKKLYFAKNGTWQNSGVPTSGSTGTGAISLASGDRTWVFASSVNGTNISANFGNGYFNTAAVSSAGTNASGNGIFEYDVPTGYTALSTKGLNL